MRVYNVMLVVRFLLVFELSSAFYFSGLAPVNYCRTESPNCKSKVALYVNKLDSDQSLLSYEYHDFGFCPADESDSPVENLGQVVFGDRIRSSPYKILFGTDEECVTLCSRQYIGGNKESAAKLSLLKKGMTMNYYHHWIVDNTPVTWCYRAEGGSNYCATGFPMGCNVNKAGKQKYACVLNRAYKTPNSYYVFNHVDIQITYHPGTNEDWGSSLKDSGRIISAKVFVRSIKQMAAGPRGCGDNAPPMEIQGDPLTDGEKLSINYTYSVLFKVDQTVKWSSRWDYILESMPHANVQWFSILNSLILSGIAALILLRTFRKDLARYRQIEAAMSLQKDAPEMFGWKLVAGDVFRPPRKGAMLSVVLGSGIQVLLMTLITLVFASLGFLSPANRGAFATCAIFSFVCSGIPAGYVSSRMYKSFGGEKWISNILLTSLFCPGVVFVLVFAINLLLWGMASSAAIPVTTLLTLLALWFGISIPLTYVGGYYGFRETVIQHPTSTNQSPREIPVQSIILQLLPAIVMGGALPFGCIFLQLYFILNSLWSNQIYNKFGCLILVFIILVITCALSTILQCYFHLRTENYHWWWRSFWSSGFAAFFLYIYSIHYFVTKLSVAGFVSTLLYFGYTCIMAFLFFLLTGTIGFFACFFFLRKIYSL